MDPPSRSNPDCDMVCETYLLRTHDDLYPVTPGADMYNKAQGAVLDAACRDTEKARFLVVMDDFLHTDFFVQNAGSNDIWLSFLLSWTVDSGHGQPNGLTWSHMDSL